jgi:hypothetical protein
MKRALLVCAAVMALAGCATTSPSGDIVTGYGIMKLTEEAVKDDVEKAQRVRLMAEQVRAAAANQEFQSVDLLMAEVRRHIPWDRISPADTFFANEMLRLWRDDLVTRFGEGILPEDIRLSVEKVAGWVILAARP